MIVIFFTDEEDEDEEEEEEEDSSDMDVEVGVSDKFQKDKYVTYLSFQECEKKRAQYIEDLTELENQFSVLREQLYRERSTQISAKLEEVKAGRATEYLQPLEELQINMKNRLEVGSTLLEFRLSNIECKYEAEKLAARQNFEVI